MLTPKELIERIGEMLDGTKPPDACYALGVLSAACLASMNDEAFEGWIETLRVARAQAIDDNLTPQGRA